MRLVVEVLRWIRSVTLVVFGGAGRSQILQESQDAREASAAEEEKGQRRTLKARVRAASDDDFVAQCRIPVGVVSGCVRAHSAQAQHESCCRCARSLNTIVESEGRRCCVAISKAGADKGSAARECRFGGRFGRVIRSGLMTRWRPSSSSSHAEASCAASSAAPLIMICA